jgi:hypothetical protein
MNADLEVVDVEMLANQGKSVPSSRTYRTVNVGCGESRPFLCFLLVKNET